MLPPDKRRRAVLRDRLGVGGWLGGAPYLRSHLNTLASLWAFPAFGLLPIVVLVLMFGYLAALYLRDPFLTYNDMDTLSAVLFSGATVLAVAALISNTLAYFMDVHE